MLGEYASGLLKEARFSDMHIREPYWALFMAWDSRIRRRLKLRDLDTFLAVAQSGSMAKAAARLAVSQPAVSNAIAELERTLGVRLFDGSRRASNRPYMVGRCSSRQWRSLTMCSKA
jgi:hypothetical protein